MQGYKKPIQIQVKWVEHREAYPLHFILQS